MTDVLFWCNPFMLLFFLLPPALIIARYINRLPIPFRHMVPAYIVVGHLLNWLAWKTYLWSLELVLDTISTEELITAMVDFEKYQFIYPWLGWAFAGVYFTLCWVPLAVMFQVSRSTNPENGPREHRQPIPSSRASGDIR